MQSPVWARSPPRPPRAPDRPRPPSPVTVWWTQGFYEAENKAVIDNLAAWEKATGTKVNLTIMNGPDLITKLIAAMQVGDVPDLVHSVTGDRFLVPRAAWDDQLVDRDRRHRQPEGGVPSDRLSGLALLQCQAEEALLLHRADQVLDPDGAGMAAADRGSRLLRRRHAQDP